MRAVASPATFGGRVGGADAGPQTPGAAAHDDAAHGSPFATMLATRLDAPKTAAAGQASSGDQSSDAGADEADEPTHADASSAVPALLAAVASAMTPAATSGPATASSVTHVSRDPNSLAPALRERLGRVVARMQSEYGDTVQIAEAGRTQARQNFLFAQGRTRSGPVVTWTRDSAHTRGRAVDVTINGGYDDAAAFARLQQIAQSEGLRTLGARDPGHLELPRGVPGEVPALGADAGGAAQITVESFGVRTEAGAVRPNGASLAALPAAAGAPATVAPVAAVASVAEVATVASVASVAPAGAAGAPARATTAGGDADGHTHGSHARHTGAAHASSSASNAARALDVVPGPDGGPSGESADPRSGDHAPDRDTDARDRGADAGVTPSGAAAAAPTAAVPSASGTPTPGAPAAGAPAASSTGAPVLGAVAAERIARVLDAQQAAAPRTVSHLTLRVDRADGGTDRIHLDLRGRAVDARIDVADLGTADALTARTPELRAALAQHGLTTDDVRVRSAGDVSRIGAAASGVALDDGAVALGTGSRGSASQTTGDGGARDQTPDQPSRDPGGRDERSSDGRPPQRDAQDGSASGRRTGDQRQGRRTPADALDTPVQRPITRTTS